MGVGAATHTETFVALHAIMMKVSFIMKSGGSIVMKTSDKLRTNGSLPWRGTWHGLDPRTKVVKPKKGRGSYNRKQKRGLERIRDGDAQDLLLFRLRGTI